MRESLQKVLDELIVKRYDSIVGVDVSNFYMNEDWYRIIYYFAPPIERELAIEIMEETSSLYRMLGSKKDGDIIVDFKPSEDSDED